MLIFRLSIYKSKTYTGFIKNRFSNVKMYIVAVTFMAIYHTSNNDNLYPFTTSG